MHRTDDSAIDRCIVVRCQQWNRPNHELLLWNKNKMPVIETKQSSTVYQIVVVVNVLCCCQPVDGSLICIV